VTGKMLTETKLKNAIVITAIALKDMLIAELLSSFEQ
jgi:hypothetical protein